MIILNLWPTGPQKYYQTIPQKIFGKLVSSQAVMTSIWLAAKFNFAKIQKFSFYPRPKLQNLAIDAIKTFSAITNHRSRPKNSLQHPICSGLDSPNQVLTCSAYFVTQLPIFAFTAFTAVARSARGCGAMHTSRAPNLLLT